MPVRPAHPVFPLALAAALALAACNVSTGSPAVQTPGRTVSEAPAVTSVPSGPAAPGPTLTPVPGGQTVGPEPLPTVGGVVQTDWGAILVALPDTFPIYPGAGIVDMPELATASFAVPVDLETVTTWYVEALGERGYQLELSDPLEDGGRVLDVASDLPECRIQVAFRPEADSTIMTVLYGAGCAGLGG